MSLVWGAAAKEETLMKNEIARSLLISIFALNAAYSESSE